MELTKTGNYKVKNTYITNEKLTTLVIEGKDYKVETVIDTALVDYISQYNWYLVVPDKGYIGSTVKGSKKHTYLHQYIMLKQEGVLTGADNKLVVDHIDRNTLNNTVDNLRVTSYQENNLNSDRAFRNEYHDNQDGTTTLVIYREGNPYKFLIDTDKVDRVNHLTWTINERFIPFSGVNLKQKKPSGIITALFNRKAVRIDTSINDFSSKNIRLAKVKNKLKREHYTDKKTVRVNDQVSQVIYGKYVYSFDTKFLEQVKQLNFEYAGGLNVKDNNKYIRFSKYIYSLAGNKTNKHVRHKDGNPFNCLVDNLYTSEPKKYYKTKAEKVQEKYESIISNLLNK